ncbi:2-succinyl-6-hydroxy-2,4-cyclohexadiene-1-carboxylate synthase [Enterobacteriales bacterium SAP-6]|uniref:2-succinyl-6-hydroxy-2,4-cyclohexadiene-1-carboxylate synthase n=2 Tax=Acerihabitans arboris TaxID=2691583 RepID=A0A845SRW5_9GAMM|nr:2-succinyl-6-hydroxy-2,4-cyclohexadiene-1-carboxylate synthase [Acerihabitans arboris]
MRRGDPGRPWLVWLHGLLGSGGDWLPVLPWFSDWSLLTLNLPGHGRPVPDGLDFAGVSRGLAQTLAALDIRSYILIGYSLGGRIALYHACRNGLDRSGPGRHDLHRNSPGGNDPGGLRGVFVEGAHPGLSSRRERDDRLLHDSAWAQRFSRQPLPSVLADWYRQPVFGDLSDAARRELVTLRAANDGAAIAGMLQATSLALQPDLSARLRALDLPLGYLCGERDGKFSALARRAALPFVLVPDAGHNAHRANPPAFAGQLLALLAPFY